ncbi:MAG: pyrroloquinoline quinone biosynthesis protein PqqE [Acidobacteria bacterium]|nr:pyrroloquinoline quinone biosynthesis protein PqqE [Acidobacteriota bacterium]MBS1866898.1 pyrroloquinoline quinone biosynthesis protein PqqE [Acidobacteriota bacterium]
MTNSLHSPLALVCELTHRCPLHCVYCSNPRELAARATELSIESWASVFKQAAELGVLQADFTGGEPLARTDIVELIRAARAAGLYVNLITSGLPLDEAKLDSLLAAGLDHFQLSFQSATESIAEEISGTKTHAQKLRVLEWLKPRRVAVTLNFVLHRRNLHQIGEMLAIAESSSATRVEFANVQYCGWGFANREHLLPTRAQLDQFLIDVKAAEERFRGKIRVEYVVPDYYAKYPKPCMGGWGRKVMLISPNGDALPCHAAAVIPGLHFENVREKSMREIWESGEAFQKFRGEAWMQEPCKSCDRRAQDFGGCRCQALLIAGDASATDPVCSLSPNRAKVDAVLAGIQEPQTTPSAEFLYRTNPS